MIWNPFKSKPGPALDNDRVWRTTSARHAALYREATEANPVLVVAHFRATLEELRSLFAAQGQPCRAFTDRIDAAVLARPGGLSKANGIPLALAEALPEGPGAKRDGELLVLGAEHHFLPEKDARIAAFCTALPMRTRLRFHESLEAPLLGAFMGADMQKLLEELEIPATECLEHAMVTRAIRNAQEKHAEIRTGDRAADSAQAWARLNLPQA